MEATEQYFPVVLYIMLYNFHMDETLNCSHWNKNCLITTLFSVARFIMLSKTVLQHFQFLIARTRGFNSKARNWNTCKLDSDFSTYLSYWVEVFYVTLKSVCLEESLSVIKGTKTASSAREPKGETLFRVSISWPFQSAWVTGYTS